MFTSEPRSNTIQRRQRNAGTYPELQWSSPSQIADVDAAYPDRLPSSFTRGAIGVANQTYDVLPSSKAVSLPWEPPPLPATPDRTPPQGVRRVGSQRGAPAAPAQGVVRSGSASKPGAATIGGVLGKARDAIPQGVRDVAGRAVRDTASQLSSGEAFLDELVPGLDIGTFAGEQIGRIPKAGGALRTAFDVGLAPATIGSAGIGPGSQAAIRGLPTWARLTANVAAPVSRSANFGTRLAAETAIGTAATVGAQEAAERTDNPLLIGAAGLGAGILASGGVSAAPGVGRAAKKGALRYRDLTENIPVGMSVKRVVDATETTPRIVLPPETGDIIGLRPIEAGLTKGQQRLNAVRRVLGGVEDNDITTPAMAERARVKPQIESQAKRFGMAAQASVKQAFPDFDGIRVPSLAGIDPSIPGAPTVQDIAARLPLFDDLLTPAQRQTMAALRSESDQWRSLLDAKAIEVGARQDVMDGGFYLPRGRADLEGIDAPVKIRAGGVGGTSSGYKKGAVFGSQAEGIAAGYEYSPLGEALESYGRQAGNDALNSHVKQYLLAATKDGEAVFQSAADRLDPELRGEVLALRDRIASRTQTVRNQGVRAAAQEGEAARAGRQAKTLQERALSAETRATLRKSTIEEIDTSTPSEVRNWLPDTESLTKRANSLRAEIAKNPANRSAVRQLGETEALITIRYAAIDAGTDTDAMVRAVENAAEQVSRYTSDARAPTGSSVKAPAFGSPERAAYEADRAAFGAKKQRGGSVARQAQGAPFDGPVQAVRDYEDTLVKMLASETFDVSKNASTSDVIKAADREMRTLQRLARQSGSQAERAGARADATNIRRGRTFEALNADRAELDSLSSRWQAAQKKAAETPRDAGRVGLPGMQGYTAADDVVNAANKILRNEGEMRGAGTIPLRAFAALNNFQRGLRATGDNSFAMIQGLLGMGDNPQGYQRAMRAMVRAWGDPDAAGKALNAFDERVAGTGRLTSSDWAKVLHYTGPDTEFAAGQGLPGRVKTAVQKAPLIKQSNRAFGTAGDVLRPEWADTLLEQEMKSTGKTAQELWDDGTVQRIGRIVDRMTGTVPGSKVGNYTDAFLFAGRFMQSKLETLALAAKGTVKGPIPGVSTTLEERAARRAMLRMIALGTALTVAANEARGEKTDFRPVVDGRKNSNFMRIRAGGRDYSLFGTWDSLLGQMVNLGMAGAKAAGGGYAEGAEQVADSFRGIASTPIALAWDLISGENFIGEKTRDTKSKTLQTIAESFTPFSSSETAGSGAAVVRAATSGDAGDAAQALGEGLYANLGGKSSPLSTSDQVAEGNYAKLKGEPQFKAIAGEAWRMLASDPRTKELTGGADSIYDYRDQIRAQVTSDSRVKDLSPAMQEQIVTAVMENSPVIRLHQALAGATETRWVKENPQEALKKWNENASLPFYEQKWMPTKEQQQIILALTGGAR